MVPILLCQFFGPPCRDQSNSVKFVKYGTTFTIILHFIGSVAVSSVFHWRSSTVEILLQERRNESKLR